MTIIGRTFNLYRRKGLNTTLRTIWQKALLGRIGRIFRSSLGDRLHQKLLMYPRLGYWPQIRDPRTFNEKLLHRKLYTDDDRFTCIEDKWSVRRYVSERVGSEVLPEVYCITDNPESIDFDSLPPKYVIKPTHLSGPVILVSEGESIDRVQIRQKANEWLNRTHGTMKGEYWYNRIKPRIIVEERLYGRDSEVPRDFKFFVFHGRVEYIQVDYDRYSNHTRRLYDHEWNPQDFSLKFPIGPESDRPDRFDKMVEIAECLGEGFDFVRVDLYNTRDSRIVFGEMTVMPGSGGERFCPVKYDYKFGSLW